MHAATRTLVDFTIDGGLMALAVAAVIAVSGCDRKETILDVETPGTNIEVDRDKDTGRVEVNVDRDR